MTKFETLKGMIHANIKANKKHVYGFMFMSDRQKQALITFINQNWDGLREESPKYFWENKKKTTNIAKSGKNILQEVVITRMAMAAFVSRPFEEDVCEVVQETKSFEPIPEI